MPMTAIPDTTCLLQASFAMKNLTDYAIPKDGCALSRTQTEILSEVVVVALDPRRVCRDINIRVIIND